MAKAKKYTIRKYNGDDLYSWAVFRKDSIPKGHRGVVFYGQAEPILCGLGKREAENYRDQYARRDSSV